MSALCSSLHSSVTREGQGGTHQYHTVGSHIFLVADVHFRPILFICPQVAKLLGGSERLTPLAVEYMLWFVPFSLFTALLNSGMFFLRLDGSPNFAMMCNVVAAVLNILLDICSSSPLTGGCSVPHWQVL